ncbi:agmatinase family protein [Natrialba sp. INN-245]|uniref:agmatinase family protein n=1 Tax=Natrialba sp. INN-245 TaxID=2690967 RepID=UPI00130FC959|nr:agmatinase family protein [Natrialba sp. INN-245]MWV39775.1 agmatinase [Natrialba sp. INN-245]
MNDSNTGRPELAYEGIETFLKSEYRSVDQIGDNTDAGVIGVPFDGGVSNKAGARYGPRGIRRASSWFGYVGQHELMNVDTRQEARLADIELCDVGDVPTFPTDIISTSEQIQKYVRALSHQTFPIILGGDHYLTYPSFVGFASTVDGEVGLVHLDAHSDTIPETAAHGEHFHGSSMSRLAESEYFSPNRHAMVGIRGYEATGFDDEMKNRGCHVSYRTDIANKGIVPCVREAVDHAIKHADVLYVTVDIDIVDPAFAPGTGTPVPGGLSSTEFLEAMTELGRYDEVAALDLVEVAPPLDPTDATANLTANGIVRFLEKRFLANR